ncbi:MAG: hypothetical protein Q9219_002693 [cf. Caloplaca sp. 3 TL-2023]
MITSRPRDDIFRYYPTCKNCQKTPLRMYHYCDVCDNGLFELCQECVDSGIHCYEKNHELAEPVEVFVDIEPTDDDIRRYVKHELKHVLELGHRPSRDRKHTSSKRGTTRLGRICRDDPELQTMIPDAILASANGMFMLAKLYMSAIQVKTSPGEVRDTLEHLPEGYDDSYKATMERIETTGLINPNDTSSTLAKRALMWVACSYRPLSLSELQEALAIDLDNPDVRSLYRYDKETLLEITAGLLFVNGDETSVNLCHTTASEYFTKTQAIWFPHAASKISQCCLQYLGRPEFAEPCGGFREYEAFEERKRKHPFLAYAYLYWGNHAYDAGSDEKVQDAVIRYLEDTNRVDSFIQAAWYLNSAGSATWDVRKGATSLHVAAWFGLTKVTMDLLNQGSEIDAQDPADGLTPLMLACRRGKVDVARLLLERGASINTRSHAESTALFEAVMANQSPVVKTLLGSSKLDVNEEHLLNSERTALMFAIKDNYTDIVSLLLADPRIDIDKVDLEGNTALMFAAKAGQTDSLSQLLEQEKISVDIVDQNKSSALIHAARNGWTEIVDRLLLKGANPLIKDLDGGTALLRAIDNGHTAVVQRLLESSDASSQEKDHAGRTLLHGAAINGYSEIIKLLIEQGHDKDAQDDKGRTPLHDASRNGKTEAVTTLLSLGANTHLEDTYDRTPWTVAWLNGQSQTMLLLDHHHHHHHKTPSTQPSSKEKEEDEYPNINALPIWSLAKLGRADILTQALKHRPETLYHLDPDTDNTALHTAVLARNVPILKLLLGAGLSPNTPNAQFRTPLHLAVLLGSVACTKVLLSSSSTTTTNPLLLNTPDTFHQTPLLVAQIYSHLEIALLLIEAGAEVDPHVVRVQEMLFAAVEFARPLAVQKLLDKGGSVLVKNRAGKTAEGVAREVAAAGVRMGRAGSRMEDGANGDEKEEAEEDSEEENRIGRVLQILRANKSLYVHVRSDDAPTTTMENESVHFSLRRSGGWMCFDDDEEEEEDKGDEKKKERGRNKEVLR